MGIWNAFMFSLSVGASIYIYIKNIKKSLVYLVVVFAVHLTLFQDPARYNYGMLYTVVTLFLIMVAADHKKIIDALYESTATVAKILLCVLFFTNFVVLIFPNWYKTTSYYIGASVWQLIGLIIISHFEVDFAHFKLKITSKVFSVVLFSMIIGFYGGVVPFLLDKTFDVYYSAFGFFTTFIIPVTYFGSMYVSMLEIQKGKTENELERQTDLYENMNGIWKDAIKANHHLLGLFSTAIVHIESNDFDGFKNYFYENIEPEISREPQKVINLDNIGIDLIRNQIYYQYKRAKANNISMDIDIRGKNRNFDIDKQDLQKILTIWFDNAIEASKKVENPHISLIIENGEKSVSIELANRFNSNALIQNKSKNRGHGLRLVDEYLSRYENVIKHKYTEGTTFTQKIIIGADNYEDTS